MGASVIVWDIETVPELKGFAAANGYEGKLNADYSARPRNGWSLLRSRTGNAAPENFDLIDDVLNTFGA
jgi:hypothetical protein